MEEKAMMTLRLFSRKFESVPASTTWYLTDLGEARGKQELVTRQSSRRLKALREHALIESTVSSNRVEKDGDIIEKFPDARSRARFRKVPAVDMPICLKDLAVLYDGAIKEQ
jgi:hypothetical protein